MLRGHFIIDINERDCTCGSKGCDETLGGSKELAKFPPLIEGFFESRLASEKQINMETLVRMMKQNDILPVLIKKVNSIAWTPWGKVSFEAAENPDISVLLGLETMIMKNTLGGKYGVQKYWKDK